MKVKGRFVLRAVRGLLEGAYWNTQVGEMCTFYSRARTKQGAD